MSQGSQTGLLPSGFTFDTSCLFSVVKNISGVKMQFSNLPPHGAELDADEELAVWGHITEAVRGRTRSGRTPTDALERLLDGQYLQIQSTPAPVLLDTVTAANKIIVLNNGVLGVDDPCWETSLTV